MIKVQVFIPKTLLAEDYESSGELLLDMNSDLVFFSNREEVNDLNQITEEAILGFSAPRTAKNMRIAESFDLENVKDEPLPISVRVSIDGQVIQQDLLTILNVSDESETYECEILRNEEHWISNLDFALCDLDYPEYLFSELTTQQYNINGIPYVDGQDGIAFPPINYGTFIGRNRIAVEDLRPFISVLKLMRDGFCSIGWKFVCPLLETPYGRRLFAYLLKENLSLESQNEQIVAAYSSNQFFTGNIPLETNISFAPFSFKEVVHQNAITPSPFYLDNRYFTAPGVFNITFQGEAIGGGGSGSYQITFEIVRFNSSGESVIAQYQQTYYAGTSAWQVSADDVQINVGDLVFLRISGIYNAGGILQGIWGWVFSSQFSAVQIKGLPTRGSLVPLKQIVSCDYQFLDFVKGVSHLFNFKFVTDWGNRTVYAYTTDDQDVFGVEVDGYYTDEIGEIEAIRQTRSVLNKRPDNRFALLKFKDSSDPYVKKFETDLGANADPLHSKRLDYGANLPAETSVYANPFFEATINDQISSVTFNGINADMPFMLDNLDNKLSFKIAPRIVYISEDGDQYTGMLNNLQLVEYRGFGPIAYKYPWAYQKQSDTHFYQPDPKIRDENVVYGDIKKDLSRYWVRDLYSRFILKELLYKLLSTFENYTKLDFRKLYRINYGGREYLGRLLNVENQSSLTQTADATFLPEVTIPLCDIVQEPVEVVLCSNSAALNAFVYVELDFCIGLFVTRQYASPGFVETYAVSYDNGENWTAVTPATVICCEDHNGQPFIGRLTVTFEDDCPDLIIYKEFDPCELLQANYEIVCTIDANNCATVAVEGVETNNFVIYYNVDGGDEQPYIGAVCLEPDQVINWRVVVTSECCGEVEITSSCFTDPLDCDFEFGVACNFVNPTTLELTPTGLIPDGVALDIIQYRCVGDTKWCTINCTDTNVTIDCECLEIKRVIVFCDNTCPTRCFTTICCNDTPPCTEVEGGTPLNLVICN